MQYEIGKLIPGLNYEQYDAVPGLRASHLKLLKKSPAHLQVSIGEPSETSGALEFGKMFHLAVENGERFLDTYVVEPDVDKRTKVGKETLSDFYVKLERGRTVVKAKWAKPLLGMLRSIMSHKMASAMLKNCVRETSCWVQDEDTGLMLKFRPDILTAAHGRIVDLKTTRDATPNFFERQIYSDRSPDEPFYVLSAAHYTHCARLSKQCNGDAMVFIAIEKEPPYGIMIYPLGEPEIECGENWREYLTWRYSQCAAANHWPCYDERAYPLMVPQWVSNAPTRDIPKEEVGF